MNEALKEIDKDSPVRAAMRIQPRRLDLDKFIKGKRVDLESECASTQRGSDLLG